MAELLERLEAASVVVCCGPGGVGKTTVSATIAAELARRGRRACVLTVDPARRLADALGLDAVGNTPHRVDLEVAGTLDAVMLDAQGTFDDLVARYARDPAQRQRIAENRLYRSMTSSLGGTQEYMAMEKLYELASSGDYDVVVVDTPPTRHALDLLDAPRRLTNLLRNRVFRAMLLPTRAYLKAVGVATSALLRTISVVAGAELVADTVDFFQAFTGMEEGFADRADAVRALLAEPTTCFVVVTSPRADAIAEASFFAEKLGEAGLSTTGGVVNRVQASFGEVPELDGELGALAPHLENLRRLEHQALADADAVQSLRRALQPAPVVGLTLAGGAVNDLEALELLGAQLSGASTSPAEHHG